MFNQKNWHYQHKPGFDHRETCGRQNHMCYTGVFCGDCIVTCSAAHHVRKICFFWSLRTYPKLSVSFCMFMLCTIYTDYHCLMVVCRLLHGHQELWSHSMSLLKWSYKIPNLLALSLGLKRFTCLFKQLATSLRLQDIQTQGERQWLFDVTRLIL